MRCEQHCTSRLQAPFQLVFEDERASRIKTIERLIKHDQLRLTEKRQQYAKFLSSAKRRPRYELSLSSGLRVLRDNAEMCFCPRHWVRADRTTRLPRYERRCR